MVRRSTGVRATFSDTRLLYWHKTDSVAASRDVRSSGQSRSGVEAPPLPSLTRMYGPAVRCKRFVDLVVSGLASMYPVSSWSRFAPDHHGYQRACDLINGQASTGPCGSPVFACAGKTDPPSLLILSQTSAGNC